MKIGGRIALALSSAALAAACSEPLDTNRTNSGSTFGEIVLNLACQRMAFTEDARDGKITADGGEWPAICKEGLAAPPSAADSIKALFAARPDLVAGIDGAFPDEFLPDLQTFLTSNEFLATYDDETAEHAIDSLIGFLRLMADDGEAVDALERLNWRIGYRPLKPALGAVRSVVNYPGMHDLLLSLGEAVTKGGSARGEWENLLKALGATLRDVRASDNPGAPDRTLRIALDLLLSERAQLGTERPIPLVLRDEHGVALLARVGANTPFLDQNGDRAGDLEPVTGRFLGSDGQVLRGNTPFAAPTGVLPKDMEPAQNDPQQQFGRDELGRLIDASGAPLYRYVDLDKTLVAALARDGIQLFDPQKGTALDLLRGTSALMGERAMTTHTYDNGETLAYRGFVDADGDQKLDESPMLDVAYGALQLLRDPGIYDTLALARKLLTDNEADLSRLAEAAVVTARFGNQHPEAELPDDSPMWDDLLPVVRQILEKPQLVADLMKALEAPEVAQLSERFGKYMKYSNRFDIDPTTLQVMGAFTTLVDRTRADTGANRSIFQRILHIIHDSNHAQMCNKEGAKVKAGGLTYPPLGPGYGRCDLIQIDNLAVLYVQSMVYAKDSQRRIICENADGDEGAHVAQASDCARQGTGIRPRPKAFMEFKDGVVNFAIDNLLGGEDAALEGNSGITGFRRHPTPEALNRVLVFNENNMPEFLKSVIVPVQDVEGDEFNFQHPGVLPVWEKEGFYDQMRPIVQAFADNDAEQLFVDLLSAMHKHWPSKDSLDHQTRDPNADNYVFGSGGVVYEQLLGDVFADGSLLKALVATAPALNAVRVNGTSYSEILRNAGLFMIRPQAGLADRLGKTTTTTADGKPINQLSPFHVLADAYGRKKVRMRAIGGEAAAWTDSVSEVIDVLARGIAVPGQGWRFKNPRMRGVSLALLDFVEGRLRVHDTARDSNAWLSTKLPTDLQDLLTSPVFAGAADFVLSLQATPETRQHLDGLVQYLVDEATNSEAFQASLTSMADMAQFALSDADIVPIAHVVGEAIKPERGWVDNQLEFLKRARQSDQGEALVRMMRNLYAENSSGQTAVGDLIDGISEVHRAHPYAEANERYKAEDFRALLRGVADFLDDERRGLRKFIRIIQSRNLK